MYAKGINYKFPVHHIGFCALCQAVQQKRRLPPFREPRKGKSALAEGLAVGALIHGGIGLVGAHQNPIQRAVILFFAVMRALVYGALNALVGMAIHSFFLLLIGFGLSMARMKKRIQEILSKLNV